MRKELMKIKGFSEIKVEKVKDAASKMVVSSSRSFPQICDFANDHPAVRQWLHDGCGAWPSAKKMYSYYYWKQTA
jgi:hypothetical protein